MNFSTLAPLILLASLVIATPTPQSSSVPSSITQRLPKCRFAPRYTHQDVLKYTGPFIDSMLYWEGHFLQNNVSYNSYNGMTYDGTLLNEVTGRATKKHPFSAASKESLQIMLFAQAIAGSKDAARVISPLDIPKAPYVAYDIMRLKLKTYLKFNETFPGFGGFIPWYTGDQMDIVPTYDWVNRVPALDNGELIWAVYAVIQALSISLNPTFQQLAKEWQTWLDYTKVTAKQIFNPSPGIVCAVTSIKDQLLSPNSASQNYKCEGIGRLNDPYEGELFVWWLYFFGGLSKSEKEELWILKRPQLVSVEYEMDGFGPVTVQKGFWFSAHEQWKVLEMPYYDVPIVKELYRNAEVVRTCNSYLTHNPGMFASVNNSTDPNTGEILGYISNAGIPSISNQTVQELSVITPYAVFPVTLFDKSVGMVWWWNIVKAKRMQNSYGSSESARIDGTATSSFVSWDSKMTTVVAILGGVTDLVRQKMLTDGVYKDFLHVTNREYSHVFTEIKGSGKSFCLPNANAPDTGLVDYTDCN